MEGSALNYDMRREDAYKFADSGGYEYHEKGDELEFKYCPYCHGGDHRDQWTFSINLTSGAYKCLRSSCDKQGHFVELCRDFHYPLMGKRLSIYRKLPPRPNMDSADEAVRYMESRGISAAITRKYHITVQTDKKHILVFPFFAPDKELVFVKYRLMNFQKGRDKNKEWSEPGAMPILFGMDNCVDFSRLVITEGQIDSLSLAEAGVKNAVSVPTGQSGMTWLRPCRDWLLEFKEIVVFGDCENGRITLIDNLKKKLPPSMVIKVVQMEDYKGLKDANDILREYGKEYLAACVERAVVERPSIVKDLADVEDVDLNTLDKIKTGIKELDNTIDGMAAGQLVVLTGKRGEGKSTFMSQIVASALDQKRTVFVYSGELADFHFKRWLDFQLAGDREIQEVEQDPPDPDAPPKYTLPKDKQQQITQWYRERAYIYDNSFYSVNPDVEYETLTETIKSAVEKYNIDLVCIDNLMTAMETVSEQNNLNLAQSNFVGALKNIATQYGIVIILVAHPKKGSANDIQDDNDLVAGSSDITNKADIVLKYSRFEDDSGEADSIIKVTKNRLLGYLRGRNEDAIRVRYSPRSKRITGVKDNPNAVYGWKIMNTSGFREIDDTDELPF